MQGIGVIASLQYMFTFDLFEIEFGYDIYQLNDNN